MIRFQDLSIKNSKAIEDQIVIFRKFLKSGQFILGKEVEQIEKLISKKIKKKYTVGVSSGTNALYLALKSINLKKDDQVLVPCLSWLSTFTAVKVAGGEPIGIDLEKNNYLLDYKLLEKKINKRTKALMLVHYTGLIENVDKIRMICKKKNILLIEDCAQSFGAKFNNLPAGSFGHIACFSMNPMKVFASIGDAGFVSTNDYKIYKKLLSLRYAGTINKEYCIYPEINHKIDTLDALILKYKFKFLKKDISKRIAKAHMYHKFLSQNKRIILPKIFKNKQHIYYSFQILAKQRNKLMNFLKRNGIETKIQHKYLISDHKGLKSKYNQKTFFPQGNFIKNNTLSLPIHNKITDKQIKKISNLINKFYEIY